MKPRKSKNIADAIKFQEETEHPLMVALNKTGYDLDDVSVLTCIPKLRLREICKGRVPTERENMLLKGSLPEYNP
jgi:hypothetical protein